MWLINAIVNRWLDFKMACELKVDEWLFPDDADDDVGDWE